LKYDNISDSVINSDLKSNIPNHVFDHFRNLTNVAASLFSGLWEWWRVCWLQCLSVSTRL